MRMKIGVGDQIDSENEKIEDVEIIRFVDATGADCCIQRLPVCSILDGISHI